MIVTETLLIKLTLNATVFYQDLDGDGFGDIDSTVVSCEAPEGYVSDAQDCDDKTIRSIQMLMRFAMVLITIVIYELMTQKQ